MSPSNSKRSAYARPNRNANPFEDESNKNNIIIVNSDIMILPSQHESQTEEEEYDDNDDNDTSSSGAQSSHDNPLSSKSSHHAPEGTVAFRRVSRPNTGISEAAPVPHSASGVRRDPHAPNDLRQQDLEMKERALTKSPTVTMAATIAGTSSVSQDGRAVSTSPPTNPTRIKHTINSINNNGKNNNISSNDTHLNLISNHKQGRHINGTEKSDSSIPATNMREFVNDRQLGHDQGGTTTSATASATLGAGALNDARGTRSRHENSDFGANQHHPTRAQGRTHHSNSARSRDISNNNTNFDNIANNNKSSKNNPHGSVISQHNLPPSTIIKPLSFFGRFAKENKSRKKGDSLQLLQQTQPRPLTQPGSTTPSEMNSTTGSKNEKVPEKRDLGPQATGGLCLHGQGSRKRGVPGKDGEEPETDMFNFVDIMLNMPEEPTWRLVIIKLLKVLAVMTISYFALMALYFAAEVNMRLFVK